MEDAFIFCGSSGVAANAAHIHEGVAGANGPVIVPLVQDSANPNVWKVPANTTLSASQLEAFKNNRSGRRQRAGHRALPA